MKLHAKHMSSEKQPEETRKLSFDRILQQLEDKLAAQEKEINEKDKLLLVRQQNEVLLKK